MRRLLPLLLACVSTPALAITLPMSGPYLDLGVGGALDTASPLGIGPGWRLAAGWWFGHYDKDYALGEYHSFGITVDQAWLRGELVTTPMFEYRNGIDVVVVGPYWFLSAGPELAHGSVGVTALAGGGVELRRTPAVGLTARLGVGATYLDEVVRARVVLQVGFTWSKPLRGRDGGAPPAP